MYWALCWETDAVLDDGAVQTYIQATLLPQIRAKGCRKIFCDANSVVPRPDGGADVTRRHQWQIKELNDLLAASREEYMDIVEFRDRTADAVGPPLPEHRTSEVQRAYDDMCEELLGRTQRAMERWGEDGLKIAEQTWKKWVNGIGRRRGGSAEKTALDTLSVEIRAAFWPAYSAVWCRLIDQLVAYGKLNQSGRLFHALWHLAHRCESNRDDAYFHEFRGCPPALHPAMAVFIQTHAGSELVGNWLSCPYSDQRLWRLLHGLYVAVEFYANQISETAILRRRV
jgi:hypothetical protein